MAQKTGIRIVSKDATRAVRALGEVDRDVQGEVRKLVKTGVKAVRIIAVSNMRRRAGGGTYPRRSGMIEAMSDGVRLNAGGAYPWAFGAEFGAHQVWLWGRPRSQESLTRRTFAPWGGNFIRIRGQTYRGWLIAPAMQELDKFLPPLMLKQINELVVKAHRRNRVGSP